MRKIEVVEYDSAWPRMFEIERDLLRRTLGGIAVAIHHIGSTAVPGLAAKPIIDILIETTDVGALDEHNTRMRAIGYEPKGEFGIPGRRYFEKGGDNRSHHVHAFTRGDSNVRQHIAFRDCLRTNPHLAQEYGELKKRVAQACENDIERYCDGKDAYVKWIGTIAEEEKAPNRVAGRGSPGSTGSAPSAADHGVRSRRRGER
jgi:GrpB-like predicted nucleotidyltransferase (UPF0157 family)